MAKRIRTGVTKGQLAKIEGTKEVIAEIEKRMDRATGEAIKEAYMEAAKPLLTHVRGNIAGLSISDIAKRRLRAMASIMYAKRSKAYVIMGMSKSAGIAKIGPGEGPIKSPSPYWFEFGTAQRTGPPHPIYGTNRGAMKSTPFFRPALAAAKPAMRDAMAKSLKQIIVDAV